MLNTKNIGLPANLSLKGIPILKRWIVFFNRSVDQCPLSEPRHDKTNNVAVRPARIRSAWASVQSDQSLRCPHEETLGP